MFLASWLLHAALPVTLGDIVRYKTNNIKLLLQQSVDQNWQVACLATILAVVITHPLKLLWKRLQMCNNLRGNAYYPG